MGKRKGTRRRTPKKKRNGKSKTNSSAVDSTCTRSSNEQVYDHSVHYVDLPTDADHKTRFNFLDYMALAEAGNLEHNYMETVQRYKHYTDDVAVTQKILILEMIKKGNERVIAIHNKKITVMNEYYQIQMDRMRRENGELQRNLDEEKNKMVIVQQEMMKLLEKRKKEEARSQAVLQKEKEDSAKYQQKIQGLCEESTQLRKEQDIIRNNLEHEVAAQKTLVETFQQRLHKLIAENERLRKEAITVNNGLVHNTNDEGNQRDLSSPPPSMDASETNIPNLSDNIPLQQESEIDRADRWEVGDKQNETSNETAISKESIETTTTRNLQQQRNRNGNVCYQRDSSCSLSSLSSITLDSHNLHSDRVEYQESDNHISEKEMTGIRNQLRNDKAPNEQNHHTLDDAFGTDSQRSKTNGVITLSSPNLIPPAIHMDSQDVATESVMEHSTNISNESVAPTKGFASSNRQIREKKKLAPLRRSNRLQSQNAAQSTNTKISWVRLKRKRLEHTKSMLNSRNNGGASNSRKYPSKKRKRRQNELRFVFDCSISLCAD